MTFLHIKQNLKKKSFSQKFIKHCREAVLTILVLGCLITVTVVGNILVILSVLTHNPLKILSNYYVVSLAVADLTVSNNLAKFNSFYWGIS